MPKCLRCTLAHDRVLNGPSCLSQFDGWHLFELHGRRIEFRDTRYRGVEQRQLAGRYLTDEELRSLAAPVMPTSLEMVRELAAALHDEPALVPPLLECSCPHPCRPHGTYDETLVRGEPAPVTIEPERDTNFETAAQAWLFLSMLNLQDQPTEVQRKQVEITARLGHTLRKSPLWKAWAAQHDKRPKVEERPMLDEEDLL